MREKKPKNIYPKSEGGEGEIKIVVSRISSRASVYTCGSRPGSLGRWQKPTGMAAA